MKRRPPLSRRTFLKLTATVAAGAALAGCTPKQSPTSPTERLQLTLKSSRPYLPARPSEQPAPADDLRLKLPAETNPTETACQPRAHHHKAPAYLAVVHGPDPASITRLAIDALGGMASFVSYGYDVIIKPNICTDYHPPEYATHHQPHRGGDTGDACAWKQVPNACG